MKSATYDQSCSKTLRTHQSDTWAVMAYCWNVFVGLYIYDSRCHFLSSGDVRRCWPVKLPTFRRIVIPSSSN